jgi:hypothetical protein
MIDSSFDGMPTSAHSRQRLLCAVFSVLPERQIDDKVAEPSPDDAAFGRIDPVDLPPQGVRARIKNGAGDLLSHSGHRLLSAVQSPG